MSTNHSIDFAPVQVNTHCAEGQLKVGVTMRDAHIHPDLPSMPSRSLTTAEATRLAADLMNAVCYAENVRRLRSEVTA